MQEREWERELEEQRLQQQQQQDLQQDHPRELAGQRAAQQREAQPQKQPPEHLGAITKHLMSIRSPRISQEALIALGAGGTAMQATPHKLQAAQGTQSVPPGQQSSLSQGNQGYARR